MSSTTRARYVGYHHASTLCFTAFYGLRLFQEWATALVLVHGKANVSEKLQIFSSCATLSLQGQDVAP